MIELKGNIEKIIFNDDDFYIFLLNDSDTQKTYKCKGNITTVNVTKNNNISVIGDYEIHKKYGKTLVVKSARPVIVHTREGIREYLMKNIYGIGKVYATKIVNTFGDDAFDIIKDEPEKLAQISGISKRKAEKISDQFMGMSLTREEQMMFIEYGLTDAQVGKIKKKFKNNYKEILVRDPYKLIGIIDKVNFKVADKIAMLNGISKDSPIRIKALTKNELLRFAKMDGHTKYPYDKFISVTSETLGTSPEYLKKQLEDIAKNSEIIIENDYIALSSLYRMEQNIATRLSYNLDKKKINRNNVIDKIKSIEKSKNIELDKTQREAVFKAVTNNTSVITGGPGVGKTTILKIIISYLVEYNEDTVVLAAPTGKAAKRITEQTKHDASTIHRLLGIGPKSTDDSLLLVDGGSDEKVDASCIIIDEMSMVDVPLMNTLVMSIADDTRLILVGDVDQLPSVGAGSVLKDIIDSNNVPVTKLTKVHRQAEKSHIITNAHKINGQKYIDWNKKERDFFLLEQSSAYYGINWILDLYTNILPKQFKIAPTDIQILCPMKRGDLGVHSLNNYIQDKINPKNSSKEEISINDNTFREGDKIIHVKNNYGIEWTTKKGTKGSGIFNGEIGYIKKIDKNIKTIYIEYDNDKTAVYEDEDIEDITLAYAITVHKSQGSEFSVVIIPIVQGGPPLLYNKNLLYTAVTRAKDCVCLVGKQEVANMMTHNEQSNKRYTGLKEQFQKISVQEKYVS